MDGGQAKSGADGATTLEVKADSENKDGRIAQAPFMRDKAATKSFEHSIVVNGNEMSYSEKTVLEIYGKTFNHTDENKLMRV